jgi:hypothetical protein
MVIFLLDITKQKADVFNAFDSNGDLFTVVTLRDGSKIIVGYEMAKLIFEKATEARDRNVRVNE